MIFFWTSKQHEILDAEDFANDPIVRSTSGVVDPVGGKLVIGRSSPRSLLTQDCFKKTMWWTQTKMSLQYPEVV